MHVVVHARQHFADSELTIFEQRFSSLILLPPWPKEVMFLVALVCLFVCLFVGNITQKVKCELQ